MKYLLVLTLLSSLQTCTHNKHRKQLHDDWDSGSNWWCRYITKYIGGEVTIAGQTEINDTVLIKSDNEDFKIQTAASVDKFTVDTDTGNTVIEGTVDILTRNYYY